MLNLLRQELSDTARTFVIKIGTNVLSDKDQSLHFERINAIAEQVHTIRKTGKRVVLVSSGSVGAGMMLLGLKKRPTDLPHLQATAATGQANLIGIYDQAFRKHGYHAAQLLLTADDFRNRSRYLNVRNTLNTLFEFGCVPIINENDTVSVHEIKSDFPSRRRDQLEALHSVRQQHAPSRTKFGDNDELAAMVTNLLDAPLLIILSMIDGLFDGDPKLEQSKVIHTIDQWDDQIYQFVGADKTTLGTGGMQSKLTAIKKAISVGENVILANGSTPQILERILNGDEIGTAFLARGKFVPAWKRWIGFTVAPRGGYIVDDGARRAVIEKGKSLLPIGIKEVSGIFEMGEVVSIKDSNGREFARGLSNYDSHQAEFLLGNSIHDPTENYPFCEAIHRDNLTITQ